MNQNWAQTLVLSPGSLRNFISNPNPPPFRGQWGATPALVCGPPGSPDQVCYASTSSYWPQCLGSNARVDLRNGLITCDDKSFWTFPDVWTNNLQNMALNKKPAAARLVFIPSPLTGTDPVPPAGFDGKSFIVYNMNPSIGGTPNWQLLDISTPNTGNVQASDVFQTTFNPIPS